MCDSKLQLHCDKFVATIRLTKTENPSAHVMVNCNVCGNSGSILLPVVPSCECIRCNKSNHPVQNPSYQSSLHVTIIIFVYLAKLYSLNYRYHS
jgi:hypothetical protein